MTNNHHQQKTAHGTAPLKSAVAHKVATILGGPPPNQTTTEPIKIPCISPKKIKKSNKLT